MKMKCKVHVAFVLSLVVSLLIATIPEVTTNASEGMLHVKQLSTTKAKLTWKKSKKIVKYKVTVSKETSKGYKKVKTVKLGKKAVSYTANGLTAKRYYRFYVKGYDKKGKVKYKEYTYSYTGMPKPVIINDREEYGADVQATPDYITFCIDSGLGISPKGFEVYRKTVGEGDFSKIAEVKSGAKEATADTRAGYTQYSDKTVEVGKCYEYKVRGYYTDSKGKKHYSGYSSTVKAWAINQPGNYTLYTLTPLGKSVGSFDVKLSSDKANGELKIYKDGFKLGVIPADQMTEDTVVDDENQVSVRILATSEDGETWVECGSDSPEVVLAAGQEIFLRFGVFKFSSIYDEEKETYLDEYIPTDVVLLEGASLYSPISSVADVTLYGGAWANLDFCLTNDAAGYRGMTSEYSE